LKLLCIKNQKNVSVGKGKILDVSLTDSENYKIDNLKSSKYVRMQSFPGFPENLP